MPDISDVLLDSIATIQQCTCLTDDQILQKISTMGQEEDFKHAIAHIRNSDPDIKFFHVELSPAESDPDYDVCFLHGIVPKAGSGLLSVEKALIVAIMRGRVTGMLTVSTIREDVYA